MNQPPFPPFPGAAPQQAPNPFGAPLPQPVPMPQQFGQQQAPASVAFGQSQPPQQFAPQPGPFGQPQPASFGAPQQFGPQPGTAYAQQVPMQPQPQYAAPAPAFQPPALDLNNAKGTSERRPQIVHGATVDSTIERFHCFPSQNPAQRGVVWLAIDLEVFDSNHPAMPKGYKWAFMQDVNHPSANDTIKSALASILGHDPAKPVPIDLNAAYKEALGAANPLMGYKVRATGYAKPVSGVNKRGLPKQPFPVPTFAPYVEGKPLPALQAAAAPAPAQAAPAAQQAPADPPGTYRDAAGQYGPPGALYNTTTGARIA